MLPGLVKAMRPHQWVKNLFVLTPLVFAKELFDVPAAIHAFYGFAIFCASASGVYLLNDIQDVEADRAHPVKRFRPIASGRVNMHVAKIAAAVLLGVSLVCGFLLSPAYCGTVAGYLVLNIAYSASLKRIAYVDVLCIALGFELRVLAGAFAANVPASAYLIVVTFLLATFLGFGKRMHELRELREGDGGEKQRKSLRSYDQRVLARLLFGTGAATVGTYLVYTLDSATRKAFGTDYLVVTTLFAILGVGRFLYLVTQHPSADSPTEEMLRDKVFIANLLAWGIAVTVVIYFT